jgi:hypothetical protein
MFASPILPPLRLDSSTHAVAAVFEELTVGFVVGLASFGDGWLVVGAVGSFGEPLYSLGCWLGFVW